MARQFNFPMAHRGEVGVNYRTQCNQCVGIFLRTRREALDLSQTALGKLIGVAGSVVSGWETGKNPLPPERYEDVVRLLKFDRQKFAKVILRYSNPHLFEVMYPGEDKSLPKELAKLGARFFLPYGGDDAAAEGDDK